MASTIKLKRGLGAPTSGTLAAGELGLDFTYNRIYSSTDGTDIVEMGTSFNTEIEANYGMSIPDGSQLYLGNGNDLRIYHSGADSYIRDIGTGNLYLDATNLYMRTGNGAETYLSAVTDGAVSLYYDNSVKVATTSAGINVSGTVMLGDYGDLLSTTSQVGITDFSNAGIHFATLTTGLTNSDGFVINVDGSAAYLWQRENSNIYIGTNGVERCNITGSGDFLFGTTSTSPANTSSSANAGAVVLASGQIQAAVDNDSALKLNRYSTDGTLVECRRQGSSVGSITVTTTATAYNTSSDYRLKQDIQPMLNACDRVKALNPVNFAWIADGTRVDGFLAHEAQAVVPEAVVGEKDAVDADQNPIYQGIDQSKLVPLLTKALQEALARIEALEAAAV